MAHPVATAVNRRTLAWAVLFLVAGVATAVGWFPGADAAETGPRIGMAAGLLTLGGILVAGSFAGALQERTARLDAGGGCPVGARCACGHFNLKPRVTCRQCGAATSFTA